MKVFSSQTGYYPMTSSPEGNLWGENTFIDIISSLRSEHINYVREKLKE